MLTRLERDPGNIWTRQRFLDYNENQVVLVLEQMKFLEVSAAAGKLLMFGDT